MKRSRLRFAFAKLPLSLRFNHQEFCDGHKARRKTPSLTLFAGSQAAFFTAG